VTERINGNACSAVVGSRTEHLRPKLLSCVIKLDNEDIFVALPKLAIN